MTRRSFLFLALIFALILSVSSVAFADASITVDNSDDETPATVTATLIGGSSLSDNVYNRYVEGDKALAFEIVKPMEASDWKHDSEHNVNYLEYEVFTNIPKGSYWYKLNIGNWTSGFETTRDSAGNLYGRTSDSYRIEEPYFSNGSIRREYTYTWYGSDQSTVIGTTSFKVVVNYRALPHAADRDRITAAAGGSVSHGAVSYTASDTAVDTIVAVPHADVVKCSINGSITDVVGGAITLSTAENKRFEIMWYDKDGNLWSAEYVNISFISPASEFTYINHDYFTNSTKNGILGKEPVISNGTNQQGIPVTYLTYNLDLSKMDLQQLLYYHSDGETLTVPFSIDLPASAVKEGGMGSGYDLPAGVLWKILDGSQYQNYYDENGITRTVEVGYCTADGSSVIITPQGGQRAQLVKWTDTNGQEYFHMMVFVINFASETESYRVEAITPSAERVVTNCSAHPMVKNDSTTYKNGVVAYFIKGFDYSDPSRESICTAVDKPFSDVKSVTVYPQWNNSYGFDFAEFDGPCIIESYALGDNVQPETYQLEWTRGNGSKYLELITVYVVPEFQGVWMNKYWGPAEEGTVEPIDGHDDALNEHLSYDENTGRWLLDIKGDKNPDLDDDAFEYPVFMVTPPNGATHYKVSLAGSPIFSRKDYGLADEMKGLLEGDDFFEIDKNSLIWYDQDMGKLCFNFGGKSLFKTELAGTDGMSIYTVNATMPGHAQIAIFEWYKQGDGGQFDRLKGEYVYLERNSYINARVDDIGTEVTEPVDVPTAIVIGANSSELIGHKFRCEIPLQKNAGKNYWYKYYKLDLLDKNGNVVELPAGSKIKVYIPYPEGTDMNSKIQHFDVWHYHDENHGSHDSMRNDGVLKLEEYGITFETTSFSPFLVSYKAEDANDDGNGGSSNGNNSSSSGGSGISVTYNGGNSFSTSNSAVPTSVEIDGIPVSFTGDGRSFTVNSIPAGAKWITVRWNSTSITTNFAPDGNVVSAGIEIPKTGDISLLMPVLALIGAAAARCRRSSK